MNLFLYLRIRQWLSANALGHFHLNKKDTSMAGTIYAQLDQEMPFIFGGMFTKYIKNRWL